MPTAAAISYAVSGGPFTVSSTGDLITTGGLNAETSPSFSLTVFATNASGLTSQETNGDSDGQRHLYAGVQLQFFLDRRRKRGGGSRSGKRGGERCRRRRAELHGQRGTLHRFFGGRSGHDGAVERGDVAELRADDHRDDFAAWMSTEYVTVHDTAAFVPVFDSSSSFAIAENAATGTDLGSVAALDPDGGAITYSVSGGPFAISSSGDLLTAGTLNAETSPTYSLAIIATNASGLTTQEQVTVNDLAAFVPVFSSSSSVTVAVENVAVGADLGSLGAVDPDGGTLELRSQRRSLLRFLHRGSDHDGAAQRGDVTELHADDHRDQPERFSESATGDGQRYRHLRAGVQLQFVLRGFAENAAIGTDLGSVAEALDPDGGALTYSCEWGSVYRFVYRGSCDDGGFGMPETSPTYALTVVATNLNGLNDPGTSDDQ